MNVPAKLDSRQLALEIDSELPGISANNIEYLQMNPCPEMLPENFIVGGTIKSRIGEDRITELRQPVECPHAKEGDCHR